LIFYLFYILNFSISSIIALDFKMFLWIGLGAIVAPIMYRILMSVQRIFYKI
jgi:hypothetical protein